MGELVHAKYAQLGFKLHRPGEWTVLAGIIMTDERVKGDAREQVVSLASGLTCLPDLSPSPSADSGDGIGDAPLTWQVVRDMHAEVLARRGLIAFIYSQILAAQQGRPSIMQRVESKFSIREGVSFTMYTSQAPCGEASMHILEPYANAEQQLAGVETASTPTPLTAPSPKRARTVRGREQVSRRGVLRTKPGRGDCPPSSSHSCTDKLALWSVLGWGGALLEGLLREPLFVGRLLVGERWNQASLEESLNLRGPFAHGEGGGGKDDGRVAIINDRAPNLPTRRLAIEPYEGEPFPYGQMAVMRRDGRLAPARVAQVWYLGGRPETIVEGRRQGAAPPTSGTVGGGGPSLLRESLQSTLSTQRLAGLYRQITDMRGGTVVDLKLANRPYQLAKAHLLAGPFLGWRESKTTMRTFRHHLLWGGGEGEGGG